MGSRSISPLPYSNRFPQSVRSLGGGSDAAAPSLPAGFLPAPSPPAEVPSPCLSFIPTPTQAPPSRRPSARPNGLASDHTAFGSMPPPPRTSLSPTVRLPDPRRRPWLQILPAATPLPLYLLVSDAFIPTSSTEVTDGFMDPEAVRAA